MNYNSGNKHGLLHHTDPIVEENRSLFSIYTKEHELSLKETEPFN